MSTYFGRRRAPAHLLENANPTTTTAIEREAFGTDLDLRNGSYVREDQGRPILQDKEYSTADRTTRNSRVEERWVRQECLGRGSFGEVWLEVREGEPYAKRAVKEIQKTRDFDYMKEVQAMVEFSKIKYRQDGHFVDFLG
ncbi:hypothetical protein N7G274_005808 [Stereocaulon virgatum]|uniref:Protein kinase domain-containing protein n=1 Tax=Stereocaulon virgatum TaxID=373712 RepID=A0ABR4A7Q6_9LECA